MDKKIFKFDSTALSLEPAVLSANKEHRAMVLPINVRALLICEEAYIREGITGLLTNVKNLTLEEEKKVTFMVKEYQIALVVFTGNEQQTLIDIEKVANSDVSIILIGDNLPQTLLRKAIQFSVKDFISLSTVENDLLPAIKNISQQLSVHVDLAPVISIINGKGGSGASFITNCLGQVITHSSEYEIALFDADLQHGSLADILGFKPEYYLDDALQDVAELDQTAVKSMMTKRKNLSLLPVKPYSQIDCMSQVDPNKINQLLNKLRLNYPLLVADLSRGLEPLSIPIIETSDCVLVVVQQNILSIRETKALVEYLKNTMGMATEKIHLLLNRFSEKHSSISIDDLKKSVGIDSVFVVGNDYQLASSCTDLGKSIKDLANTEHIEQDLIRIISELIPLEIDFGKNRKSFWAKLTGGK
ncbi:AAA family ATPase [Thalassotalea fonticola]|uniref:AAA family ATPase n=1 Tax=Thalassotalea fonticola TaxID=3065649 RepID=A0ABZ0GU21_9GAMM|nr:AAA family ATPase [Colwelliaceae bacterium S1-1]